MFGINNKPYSKFKIFIVSNQTDLKLLNEFLERNDSYIGYNKVVLEDTDRVHYMVRYRL